MSPHHIRAAGYILAVQEQRFRLKCDQGPVLLLTLGKAVPLSDSRLRDLYSSNAHVRVEYSGTPDLVSGVAHSIKIIPPAL